MSNYQNVILETEVMNDDVQTIEHIRDAYNNFVDKSKQRSSEISDIINESELNSIRDLIVDYKLKIEEYGVKKDPTFTERTVSRLAMIPLIGGYIESKAAEYTLNKEYNKNIRDVLQEMFQVFSEKADYLEIVFSKAHELKKDLLAREIEIEEFSLQVQHTLMTTTDPLEKVAAIKLGALVEGNKLKTKEKIYNKLDFILKFIEEQLTCIALQLPGIEASLVEDVAITSFINNISDMNSMFKNLTELSNNVSRISAENIQTLITEVADSMDNGTDLNHIKKLAERNQQFMGKMVETTKRKIIHDTNTYNELTKISANLSDGLVAYNDANKKVLLETTLNIRPHPAIGASKVAE